MKAKVIQFYSEVVKSWQNQTGTWYKLFFGVNLSGKKLYKSFPNSVVKFFMTHGGKREGAGRELLYGEKAKRIMVSIPASKEAEIRRKIQDILKKHISKKK